MPARSLGSVEIMGDIIFWLIFRPFLACCQAMVGILYPAKSRGEKLAQIGAAVLLVAGLGVIVTAFVLPRFGVSFVPALVCFLVGVTFLLVAGLIGHLIENSHKSTTRSS